MKTVYLLYKFNAYRNRQIKKFNAVSDYLAAAGSYVVPTNPKNFSYNDGVNTYMDISQASGYLGNPDYLLILNPKTGNIESRWYVMESKKNQDTSYTILLHRDLIADNFEDIIAAPAFIEKATLNPADPFVFNQEQITVNRIKTRETLLRDKSNVAWIVGYMALNGVPTGVTTNVTFGINQNPDYIYSSEQNFLETMPSVFDGSIVFYSWWLDPGSDLPTTATNPQKVATKSQINIAYKNNAWASNDRIIKVKWEPNQNIEILDNEEAGAVGDYGLQVFNAFIKQTLFPNTFANNLCNNLNSSRTAMQNLIVSAATYNFNSALEAYDNKIFKIGSKYYRTKLKSTNKGYQGVATYASSETNAIVNAVKAQNWGTINNVVGASITAGLHTVEQVLDFIDITQGEYSFDLNGDEAALNKLPYKMFAIPYTRDGVIEVGETAPDKFVMNGTFGLEIANALSNKYSGAGTLIDLQLLPYCPVSTYIKNANKLKIPTESNAYTIVEGSASAKVGIIYWAIENDFTFDIDYSLNISNPKLESITDMMRLCSPNWNGQFEFNAAKNGGITKFNVDCTYKPYTPYIHINPDFGRLYGSDFNDARGLICSGDFSLPQSASEWKTYELQNKNYQNQFDRQIENLELTQDINLKKQRVQAAVNAVSGVVSGAAAGSFGGTSLAGGIVGGLIGGGASAAAAAVDDAMTRQLNQETIDYAQDQFRMRNKNIKALPDSLKQVGAITANNKIFPVLEYYTCTPEEKAAVELKLYYNGSTVERIGTIAEFLQLEETYIKAKLIRLNLEDDNHYLESIAIELNKGVFMKL